MRSLMQFGLEIPQPLSLASLFTRCVFVYACLPVWDLLSVTVVFVKGCVCLVVWLYECSVCVSSESFCVFVCVWDLLSVSLCGMRL